MPRETDSQDNSGQLAVVERKLDVVIALLATQVGSGLQAAERARILRATGMDTTAIARLLGMNPGTVRSFTTGKRAARAAARKGRLTVK